MIPRNILTASLLVAPLYNTVYVKTKFVPEGPNIPTLVQVMALRRREAIIWTNDGKFTDAYVRCSASVS